MPNMKIYLDDSVDAAARARLLAGLSAIRTLLCDRLKVPTDACQIIVMTGTGIADQPPVNIELRMLPKPDRHPDAVHALCVALQETVATQMGPGTRVTIRSGMLNPEGYIVLK